MEAAVLVSCKCAGLMTIGTLHNVVECEWIMTM